MELAVDQYVECRAPNPKRGAEDITFWGVIVKKVPRAGDGEHYWITVRPIVSYRRVGNREVTEDRIKPLNVLNALAAASDGVDE